MKLLFDIIDKMSDISARMMLYGVKFAFGVLVIGIIAYEYNQRCVGGYANSMMCIEIIRASFSLFVQFVIGGIILDCALKNR